jgi:hypothetical protein
MADVDLTIYDVDRDGVDLTANATTVNTANDYYFKNNGRVKLFVKNTTGSTVTITVETPNTVDGLAITDKTATLANNKEALLGPYPPSDYNDANQKVHVTFNQAVDIVAVRG